MGTKKFPLKDKDKGYCINAYFHICSSSPSQTVLEICIRRGVLPRYSPTIWTGPSSVHLHEMCGCGPLPLKWIGVRILNYLDDWLFLAQSKEELCAHRSLLLSHLESLGFRIKLSKSLLSPSQRISFLGAVFDSSQMPGFCRNAPWAGTSGVIQSWGQPPPENVSDPTGPHGSSLLTISLGLLLGTLSCTKALVPWKSLHLYQLGVELGSVSS